MYGGPPEKNAPEKKSETEDEGSSVDPEKLDELVKEKYLDQISQTKCKVSMYCSYSCSSLDDEWEWLCDKVRSPGRSPLTFCYFYIFTDWFSNRLLGWIRYFIMTNMLTIDS